MNVLAFSAVRNERHCLMSTVPGSVQPASRYPDYLELVMVVFGIGRLQFLMQFHRVYIAIARVMCHPVSFHYSGGVLMIIFSSAIVISRYSSP